MNREIKFRAWDKQDCRFIKGGEVLYFLYPGEQRIEVHVNEEGFVFTGEYEHNRFIIMQYTGVQDKNKKDLYEGDLVKSNTNGKLYEIRRLNNHFYCGFVPRAIDGSNENLSFEHEFVIVGNTYENADLIVKVLKPS